MKRMIKKLSPPAGMLGILGMLGTPGILGMLGMPGILGMLYTQRHVTDPCCISQVCL